MAGVIIKDLNILGGEPVFRGTRVPFKVLIAYLEGALWPKGQCGSRGKRRRH
jgi:uncharacterized protein (DUF433 family)